MKYQGNSHYQHGSPARIGVVISNLGTPEAPTKGALKTYLKEFLSDPRVVEVPRLLWWLILNGVILNIRPRRSAKAYATVWTERGSPLLFHTQDQAQGIADRLQEKYGDEVKVAYAMRYGQHSIAEALQSLFDQGVDRLVVLPLYPQYSASTNGSTYDAVAADFVQRRRIPDFRFIASYHDYAPYIDACVAHIRAFQASHGHCDKLIFSYHGVPLRYLHAGDPYHCHCYKTSRLIAEKLGLQEAQYMTTFQSRFGREEWLQPYTDHTLQALPGQGVKSVQVFCPGFSADCLETIEEIGEENRDYFMQAGGQTFAYIPALNATEAHIDALVGLIEENIQGWQRPDQQALSAEQYQVIKAQVPQHRERPD